MSTVMRPRGPLPPRVYWTRRAFLVAVVMVVGALVWWMVPSVGGSGNAAANPRGSGHPAAGRPASTGSGQAPQSAADPSTASATTGGLPDRQQPGQTGPGTGSHAKSRPTAGRPSSGHPTHVTTARHRTPLPAPTGPCDPTTVRLAVVVADTTVGKGARVGLRMSTPDRSTCSLGITPSVLETRIVSGPAVVWQSRSCPDALPAKNVVVRPAPRIVYSYTWDGQVNPSSCSATDRIAKPGGYHAQAALIGGEPHDTYFEVAAAS